jgi:hypothetical protein
MKRAFEEISQSAEQLLSELAGLKIRKKLRRRRRAGLRERDIAALLAADLLARTAGGSMVVTSSGFAHLARRASARSNSPVDPFRAQHLELVQYARTPTADAQIVDEAESPLAWLARRKSPDGRPYIEPLQLRAGERLRADFTRAQLMPRTTSNWSATTVDDRRGMAAPVTFTETVVAARQRLRRALDAVGPEFSGLLVDVCCFLKGLADVESERGWPTRSAKIVLQLGLDRLARHYGYATEARGRAHSPIRIWLAPQDGQSGQE